MRKFTIYGERCSGTNYLQKLIEINFEAEITWEYGWKHFFGFNEEKLKNSDDTLFICIVRDLESWINSFYRIKHHWYLKYNNKFDNNQKLDAFLNKEFWSFNDNNGNRDISKELMDDRNIYTGERYKNIFELRHTKLKYLIDDLPNKVNNYVFIRYEDLRKDFINTMNKIKEKGLTVKKNINFPINTNNYKGIPGTGFVLKPNIIDSKLIKNNKNLIPQYEKLLGYL